MAEKPPSTIPLRVASLVLLVLRPTRGPDGAETQSPTSAPPPPEAQEQFSRQLAYCSPPTPPASSCRG